MQTRDHTPCAPSPDPKEEAAGESASAGDDKSGVGRPAGF